MLVLSRQRDESILLFLFDILAIVGIIMVCYAVQSNQLKSAEGTSGSRPCCVTASADFTLMEKMHLLTEVYGKDPEFSKEATGIVRGNISKALKKSS